VAEPNTGERQKRLTASDGQGGDNFGWSVTIRGVVVLVGAPTTPEGGAVYVFHRDSGAVNNWGEVQKISPPNSALGDGFAVSLSYDGSFAIVGSPWKRAAYFLQRD
jgi:hypothetical protein